MHFKNYGGRGIKICSRWLGSFEAFREDMAPTYQDGLTLDRIDNDGHYCKENCRWATLLEQGSNRRTNHKIEFQGETLTIMQWERKTGLKNRVINNRLQSGWSIEKALTTPIDTTRNRKRCLNVLTQVEMNLAL